jgi:hypothetical protein
MAKTSTKPPTIASLVRLAGKSDVAFVNTVCEMLEEPDFDRLYEFLTRLNIPLAVEAAEEGEKRDLAALKMHVPDFATEIHLAEAFEKYFERHLRKIKWFVSHPDESSIAPGIRIFGCMAAMAEIRIRRVLILMGKQEVLTPEEWGTARELLNRSYRHFRVATSLATENWVESLLENCEQENVRASLAVLPDHINAFADRLSLLRDEVDARRSDMAVQPEGYPLVRPPRYFGGDLLDQTSWKHYWGDVGTLADNLRQHVSL